MASEVRRRVSTSDQETQRAIGRLEGKLDILIASVEQQAERSDAGHQRLYARVDQLAQEFVSMKNNVGNLEQRIDAIEPMATEFARWKQRGIGAWLVILVGWAVVGGFIMSGMAAAVRWAVKAVAAIE